MNANAVELHDVSVAYDGTRVVSGLSLDVPKGGWVCLIGPNGAGKTTALRAVAGTVAYTGTITLGDADQARLERRELARTVAIVPQIPVIPDGMAVLDYVLMGRTPYIPYLGTETRADVAVATSVLERLDLAGFASRPLRSLSGGELQRAVLARALAQEAPILLLDEPTTGLDVGHQQQVLELVDGLRRDRGLTVVSTMHDLTLAGQFADRIVLLAGGRPVASGAAEDVLTEPLIAEHYGASVRVLRNGSGIVVVPVRT